MPAAPPHVLLALDRNVPARLPCGLTYARRVRRSDPPAAAPRAPRPGAEVRHPLGAVPAVLAAGGGRRDRGAEGAAACGPERAARRAGPAVPQGKGDLGPADQGGELLVPL